MSSQAAKSEKVADPVWRRRLLLIDGVLILALGWLLWSVASGTDEWNRAQAEREAAADDENLRGYRIGSDAEAGAATSEASEQAPPAPGDE